jgi:hypothetical protein
MWDCCLLRKNEILMVLIKHIESWGADLYNLIIRFIDQLDNNRTLHFITNQVFA